VVSAFFLKKEPTLRKLKEIGIDILALIICFFIILYLSITYEPKYDPVSGWIM